MKGSVRGHYHGDGDVIEAGAVDGEEEGRPGAVGKGLG